ncbi:transposase family protein [Streptomyces purpurascens]|uniref:transposase family protein n=1 Tax=Streptomyces purpurascens TaxID=1924 RepID=UPI003C2B1F0F
MIDAAGCGPPGTCPQCQHPAARIHSRYWRQVAGLPVGGHRMMDADSDQQPIAPQSPLLDRIGQRHREVNELAATGMSLSAIGRRLYLDRKTVRRYRNKDLEGLLASAQDRGHNQLWRSVTRVTERHSWPVWPGTALSQPRVTSRECPRGPRGR